MMASSHPKFRFYTNREYFDEVLLGIRGTKLGDRVLLTTMTFDPTEPTVAAVCRELVRAAARGVNVTIAVDAHSFLINAAHLPGPLWSRQTLPKHMGRLYRNKLKILETINAYPTGHAAIINLPRHRFDLPVSGRSHIKTAIINDRIFIGGCNLMATNWVDLMICWHDRALSDRLYQTFQDIAHNKHAGKALAWVDRSISAANNATILLDSGGRGQSLILDEALELIDSADKWLLITCQYFPNSVTAQHLVQAMRRGVKVEIIFGNPMHQGFIGGTGQHISILRERSRVPKSLFAHALGRKDPMLHAKLIACDKGVMIGSHNYVAAGVILGTAEIALKSHDEKLAREAVAALRRGLKISKQE